MDIQRCLIQYYEQGNRDGQWLGYKNGVLYNNYAGDSKPQPGSQGFEYRTLKDRFLSIFKK